VVGRLRARCLGMFAPHTCHRAVRLFACVVVLPSPLLGLSPCSQERHTGASGHCRLPDSDDLCLQLAPVVTGSEATLGPYMRSKTMNTRRASRASASDAETCPCDCPGYRKSWGRLQGCGQHSQVRIGCGKFSLHGNTLVSTSVVTPTGDGEGKSRGTRARTCHW
jgi:hypothetical protein